MVNILSNVRTRIESVKLIRARSEARRQLLLMSDRNLEDIGVSRELLEVGVSAWPWQIIARPDIDNSIVAADLASAIRELQACSDRELSDLGLSRGGIADAVISGRPGIDYIDDRRAA